MRLWPLLVVCASLVVCDYPQDPYGTLGLRKGASIKDVKRAYKSLAREWHPDKNDSPGANEKFVSINKAYELLSDPNKKERYDKYGAFDDTPGGSPQYQQYGGFDHFFGGFGGFGGFERSDSYFQKHKISLRLFAHTIQEKSHQQPFILFAYSGYCQLCYRVEPIWQSVVEDLEPLGYGVGTISAMTDGNLLEKLRVTHLPTIMVLVEGRVVHYRGNMPNLNARSVRIFARDVIPKTFISTINTHDKLKRFVDLWRSSNKVSVLILGATPEPRLRYSLAAMKFSPTARFAYVHLGDSSAEVQEMRQALDIKCTQCENILIFNDTPDRGPVGRLSISSANQLTVDALERLINEHKFVTLPRLSSTVYLDDLCTVSSRNQRHLCVILVVMDGSEDAQYVESFRQFVSVRKQRMTAEKITAVYIYADRQTEWLRPFLAERSGPVESSARDVLVMWRYEHVKARFAWLKGAWQKSGSDAALDAHIEQVVRNGIKLNDVAPVGKLVDEHAPWWLVRLSHRVVRMLETLWFHMTKEEVYPILSVVGTFLCVFFGSYLFKYLSRPSEKKRFTPSTSDEWHPDDPETVDKEALARKDPSTKIRKIMAQMKPLMHELRAESYYGMVRLLKPGCRSIIVLLDEEHKEVLLEQFARSVHPLRNNKTFSFGYLMVEKNLPWFRKLLEHTLPLNNDEQPKEGPSMYERLKTINPRQTIGTVLVLCGWKLYFSIYHPMHAPANKKQFLGFDDDGEDADEYSDDDEDLDETASLRRSFRGVNVDNVMNGFGNWLERLLEGSIRRYYIPEWPENLK